MSKTKLIPLVDMKDNLGNFTGYSVDEDGVVYECPIKPALATGKMAIAMLAANQ